MTPYQKRTKDKMFAWVNGISRHNNIDNECCPDFSCCFPDMFEIDEDKRQARFANFMQGIQESKL